MKLTFAPGVLGALLILSACAGPQVPEARLRTTGPAVILNGTVAPERTEIGQSSSVATGPDSSALIIFTDGTRVQLDERSDPLFVWDADVLAINVGYGWFLIDTGRMRVRVRNELAEGIAGSRIAVNVVPGQRFDLYVLEGRFALERPQDRLFSTGDKFSVLAGGEVLTGTIRPAERAAILARFARWDFTPGDFVRPEFSDGPDPGGGPRDDSPDQPDGDDGQGDDGPF